MEAIDVEPTFEIEKRLNVYATFGGLFGASVEAVRICRNVHQGSDRLQIGAVDAAHIVFPLAATAATNAYAAASHIVRDGPLE